MADVDGDDGEGTEEEPEEIIPSSVDELTHAELRSIYDDSVSSILFAKGQQWRTVGSTLVLFLVLVGLVRFVSVSEYFIAVIKVVIILSGTGALFMIVIYQFWQHTESKKIAGVTPYFSSVFRKVRSVKSDVEANIHRYVLLLIMFVLIVLGGYVAIQAIDLVLPPGVIR